MYLNNSFRLDRMITLMVYHTWIKKQKPKGLRIPILMYHSISNDPEPGIHPYYRINTSPKVFSEHMKCLDENNFSVISISDALKLIESFNKNPSTQSPYHTIKYVVLTFDDGYRDFYTHAFPILKKCGFTVTVFLPTSFINDRRKFGLKGKEHLSWDEVRGLQKEGVLFGSHTITHTQLKFLNRDEIQYEIKQPKDVIEDKIGKSIDSFSYPFAFPDEDKEFKKYLAETLGGCGYRNGVSTRIGTVKNGEDSFFLKRIPVNSFDDIPFLKAKLAGGYDWLYEPQCFFKRIKNKLNHAEQKGKQAQ